MTGPDRAGGKSTRCGSLAIGIGISALIGVSLTVAPAALAASHRTSAEIDIHGQVVGTNGQPITGASITLVAWPPHRVLDNLRPGQQVPWKVLGTVVSGQTDHIAWPVSPCQRFGPW
jgi:hypothetical protein